MKDFRNWDAHETGHIELSGMTWYEYTEWALQQENNVQPSKFDNDEGRIHKEIRGREVQGTPCENESPYGGQIQGCADGLADGENLSSNS